MLRKTLIWAGRIVGGLVVLIVLAYGGVHLLSVSKGNAQVPVATHFTPVGDLEDPAIIAEGARLAKVRGCADCHGPNLGGRVFIDNPMIGRVVAANLTRPELDLDDFELGIRHGVRKDGTQLLVMPSQEFAKFTDADVTAIIAYARSLPTVTEELPTTRIGPMARVLHVAGQIEAYPASHIEHTTTHRATITPAVNLEFGEYIARGCTGCHGAGYSGGKIPGMPPEFPAARNITPDMETGIGKWSEADFIRALREGVRPDGSAIDQSAMPVPLTKHMTDTELKAVYLYLRSVPAKPLGNR